MEKIIIRMELRPRQGEIARAARRLGVSNTAIRRYLAGDLAVLARDKGRRIVIKRAKEDRT